VRVAQDAYRQRLLDANRAVIERIRDVVSGVPEAERSRRPPNGGWSIGEVLEHLIVSADSYLERLRTIIPHRGQTSPDASRMWKPSLMGGLLVRSFRSPRKMRAPKIYKPGPTPRARVLDEFLQRQEEAGRLIAQSADMDWHRVRFVSPVTSLVRMNLGDALTVLVAHAERHAVQIERVRAANAKEPQLASR
jgi:DinB superfamily